MKLQAKHKLKILSINCIKWSLRKLNQVNAEAHTVAVLTLVLNPTLVTTATATMQEIGREDQW